MTLLLGIQLVNLSCRVLIERSEYLGPDQPRYPWFTDMSNCRESLRGRRNTVLRRARSTSSSFFGQSHKPGTFHDTLTNFRHTQTHFEAEPTQIRMTSRLAHLKSLDGWTDILGNFNLLKIADY